MVNYRHLGNSVYVGITTDTKPTPASTANGAILYEFNTTYTAFNIYVNNQTAWNIQTYTNPLIKYVDVTKATADTPYSILVTDDMIRANAVGGVLTVTLPTAVGVTGKEYVIKRIDTLASTFLVTVATTSSQTISGLANYYLWASGHVTVRSDGANWQVISHSPAFRGYRNTSTTRYIAGCSYGGTTTCVVSTTLPAIDTLWALPFKVPHIQGFDTITFRVTTNSSAGGVARAGIYLDNGTCYPGKLLFDTGSIDTTSGGGAAPVVKDTTITAALQQFQPGLYWLAWECGVAAPQMSCLSAAGGLDYAIGHTTSFTTTANAAYGYSVAHSFGSLPDPYTGSATALTVTPAAAAPVPAIALRPI